MNTNEMKQIADGATAGPWSWDHNGHYVEAPARHDGEYYGQCILGTDDDKKKENSLHIATFNPQRVTKMLLALEAVKTFKANAPEGFWECGFAEDVDNAIADLEELT